MKKKVAAIWVILSSLASFVLGPGFLWEWQRSGIERARLDIDRGRASLEIREKMNATLLEIIELEIGSPARITKEEYFNAAEKNLARIEERTPIVYSFRPPSGKGTLSIKPGP